MNKRFVNAAIVYAVLAMVFGVFYREYTKILDFSGATTLSVVHTHYFAMGMTMFLLFALLDKAFGFAGQKRAGGWVVAYHVGLNLTVLGLVARGLADVQGAELSSALDASISGISGLGHTVLGVSLVAILLLVRKKATNGGE